MSVRVAARAGTTLFRGSGLVFGEGFGETGATVPAQRRKVQARPSDLVPRKREPEGLKSTVPCLAPRTQLQVYFWPWRAHIKAPLVELPPTL